MPRYLECVECGEKFKNLRALSAHKRLAHGILTGEKQEIKDSLGELGELGTHQKQILDEVHEMVKTNAFFNEKLKQRIDYIDERLKSIEEMLDGLEKDLVEEEETEEVSESNPGSGDKEQIKKELQKEFDKRFREFQEKMDELLLDKEKREQQEKEKPKENPDDKEKESFWNKWFF